MQSIRDQLLAFATAKRDEILTNCANGADDDLIAGWDNDPATDPRPSRTEVSPGCLLKPFDEIEISGGTYLYLCPGRGIGWCYVLSIQEATLLIGQVEAQYVTDRIPMDPQETPMPIFPVPEQPPP